MGAPSGWKGRSQLHDGEASDDFWRGYLWGHFDAAAEVLVAMSERGVLPADLLAAAQELKARRRRIEDEKGVLGPAQLADVHRLLTEEEEG